MRWEKLEYALLEGDDFYLLGTSKVDNAGMAKMVQTWSVLYYDSGQKCENCYKLPREAY